MIESEISAACNFGLGLNVDTLMIWGRSKSRWACFGGVVDDFKIPMSVKLPLLVQQSEIGIDN
jgi:hypothetical protein